ncbi:MAG: hypothetical protein CMD33_10815 [Flavobacteriales bacterium]|nr:hypothetical protein [Flavobacteriales bacterium]
MLRVNTALLFRWALLVLSSCFAKSLEAQWQELDAELTEQVNLGWLSLQERIRILDHLERTGLPIAVEEAWAIDGLTHGAAWALMHSLEWQHLVNRTQRHAIGRGLSAEVRFTRSPGAHSLRLRNPGKWGLRWDQGEAGVSGYLQTPIGSGGRWSALVGGHRLGWGNRTLVGESVLFAGLDTPSFALPVQYGFTPMWGPAAQDSRHGLVLHRSGRVASTLSMDRSGNLAMGVCGKGQRGIIARMDGGKPAASAFARGFLGICQWIMEAGRMQNGWAWSGACQWMHHRNSEARMKFEVFKHPELKFDWEASAGGEWRRAQCILRWHVEWGNRSEVHPLWVKWKKVWSESHTAEVHWRTAQSDNKDVRARQRLELRWQWKVEPLVIRFMVIPYADERAPGAASAFISHQFGSWRLKQSFTVWTFNAGRRAYIPEPSLAGTPYRMITGSGYRLASVLQRKVLSGFTWLVAVAYSNRPGNPEVSENMLTLTSAQTEISLSIRMNL